MVIVSIADWFDIRLILFWIKDHSNDLAFHQFNMIPINSTGLSKTDPILSMKKKQQQQQWNRLKYQTGRLGVPIPLSSKEERLIYLEHIWNLLILEQTINS